jgi:hypothetical protein
MSSVIHLHVELIQNVKLLEINQLAHVFHHTKEIHLQDVVMNVTQIMIVDHKKLAAISNVLELVLNVEKVPLVLLLLIIVLLVNVLKVTLAHHTLNVVQNVTEIQIVPDQDQLVSMEFVKIHVMELVESMLIAI